MQFVHIPASSEITTEKPQQLNVGRFILLKHMLQQVLGMVMALGFWSLCYGIQPTKTLAKPVTRLFNMVPPGAGSSNRQLAAAQRAYTLAMAQATNTVSKMSWIRSQQTAAGLTTALAESLMLRATIKPATFVFKIWASAELLLLFKGMMQTMQQNKKKASSTDTKKGDGKQNKKK